MTRRRLSRIFWIGAAAILIVAALVALTAVLYGEFSDTEGRILGTLATLLLAGGTFVSGLALVDRDGAVVGRLAALLAPVGFGFVVYAIWEIFDGSGDVWRFGWTGLLLLIALLVSVTARLLARSPGIRVLAGVAGVLSGAAATISLYAVWNHESEDLVEALTALWILTGLCYLLVPVLQRFSAAGPATSAGERIVASLGDVDLIATHAGDGIDVRLAPGERLALRKRA